MAEEKECRVNFIVEKVSKLFPCSHPDKFGCMGAQVERTKGGEINNRNKNE